MENGDPVRNFLRAKQIMDDKNGGDLQAFQQAPQFGQQILRGLGVEACRRFVEKEHLLECRNGSGNGNPLLLAAAQVLRAPFLKAL
ncbi:MAG: hypothetical protein A4E66_02318 [Syntrophus sp. PtaB.Bin001]|nr:MAG: hypothetical protein A4E66_02318 [Syntrophus sp. PtaB.Bin001]